MATILVYVKALPEKEEILHPEGVEIELPPEEEEIPLVSEGVEKKEESSLALEGVLIFEATS
jgi:hypothetical protein